MSKFSRPTTEPFVPRCVQRTGKPCNDCVHCLSEIPDGKTCGDCFAVRFCVGIGCTTPERRYCDYIPSRFASRQEGQ